MENNNVPRIPDFTVLRRIGGGSYGVVWIARSLTGIYRAVKVVERARFADARPFLRELDGITRFQQTVGNQPRQLALMHVGRDDEQGIFYYVMELADDVDASTDIDPERYTPLTLKALRDKRHRLPAAECVRLGIELARALAGLHAAGLIHRDVKPSNIIFVNGVPKLADVGLVSSSDHTLTSLGTPGYAPPEGAGTMEADVYGLGKILYELATGCATTEFPRLPAEVAESADAALLLELNEILLRACHPDPRERYQTAQAMLDDLLLIEAGKSVKELVRTKRRLRVLARASGIAALIALAALGVLGWLNYRAARQLAAQEAAARAQAEQDERLSRYSADLHLAQLALNGGDYGVARSALRRQIPKPGERDLRGIEWHALWNETAGDAERVFGEVGGPALDRAILSPDRQWLAAQSSSGESVVWNASDGRRITVPDTIQVGGFTSDSRRLIVGSTSRRVKLFDLESGQELPEQSVSGRLLSGVGDGRTVLMFKAEGGSFRLWLWDVVAQRETYSFQAPGGRIDYYPSSATVSADGRLLAFAATWVEEGNQQRRELVIWDWEQGRQQALNGDLGGVFSLAFSPDGGRIAVGSSYHPVTVLDTRTGIALRELPGHEGEVTGVGIAPDGRILTAGMDATVRLWPADQKGEPLVMRGHEGHISFGSWTGDFDRIVTTSRDGTARLWNPGVAPRRAAVGGLWSGSQGDVLFSPDGKSIVVPDAGGALIRFESANLEPLGAGFDAFHPLLYADGGRSLIALRPDNRVVIVNTDTGDVTSTELALAEGERIDSISVSTESRRAALGVGQGTVEVWDLTQMRRLARSAPHGTAFVQATAVDRSGERIASGDNHGGVSLWSLQGGDPKAIQLPHPSQAITSLMFSPDGKRLLVGRGDGSIVSWLLDEAREEQFVRAHANAVRMVTFTRQGNRMLSAADDGVIISWALPSFRQLGVLTLAGVASDGDLGIYRIATSEDERWLVAFTQDGHLRRWEIGSRL